MPMNEIILKAPPVTEAYDTTIPEFQTYVDGVVGWYSAQANSYDAIDAAARSRGGDDSRVFGFRIALKIAESHRILRNLERQVTVTLINPVYKETGRIQRREEHPHGENSIRFKAGVLKHLEQSCPHLSCRLVVVDDECPNGSGAMAEEILREEYPAEWDDGRFRVLSLSEAIDRADPDIPPGVTHKDGPNRSVKGGALLYGMRKAVPQKVDGLHIIVDNDADLSIHPGQLGLLVDPIVTGRADAVAGSRREEDSVALIGDSRNSRGQLFIKIWKHFLPGLAERLTDTNRAFKAFSAAALQQVLPNIEIYTFPYQIELLQACVSGGIPLEKRGIAYVDSEAASTQQGEAITETYLNQVHQIIDIARRYKTIDTSDPLLRFLEEISDREWQEIETNPPEHLENLLG